MSTQLCVVPGCRLRGRHEPGCDGSDCGGCLPRATDDGWACDWDTDRARDRLLDIAAQAPDARLVARGLVRRGDGGAAGGHESRLPLNDGATDALDEIRARLVALVREIAETRGLRVPAPGGQDHIVVAARWLGAQVEWMRHAVDGTEPYAIAAFAEIRDLAGRVRGIVNGPSAQKFLGPCGATIAWDEDGNEIQREKPCDGDVHGHPGAKEGSCRSCGARWSTESRTAWLDGEVRQHAFRAAHIADAYGVNVKTIRSWAERGKLRSYWITDKKLTIEWVDPELDEALTGEAKAEREREIAAELESRGPRVHYVGDVLDLAAADAARRESERAKRERRAAARAAEEASDAA